MKKALKKSIAFTLTLMLLFSAVSVQSFALFDKITDVVITEKETLTKREIDEYIAYVEEEGGAETEEDYKYYALIKADVTISTGEVISSDERGYGISENGKRSCAVDAYIDIRDYQKAVEEGSDTIPLYYTVSLYSSIDIVLDTYTGTSDVTLIECFVRKLTPVSGIPESYQATGMFGILGLVLGGTADEESFLEGAVFDIEYPDGSVVRDTVEAATADGEYEYDYLELNGEELDYWVDEEESVIEIYYMDAYITLPIEVIPFPITAIKIDDVAVSDAFEAESVTYTVTKSDSTTSTLTLDLTREPDATVFGMKGYLGESVDGIPVLFYVSKDLGEEYPPREYITVMAVADLEVTDTFEVEGPEQEGTFLGEIIYKIRQFIAKIFSFILSVG